MVACLLAMSLFAILVSLLAYFVLLGLGTLGPPKKIEGSLICIIACLLSWKRYRLARSLAKLASCFAWLASHGSLARLHQLSSHFEANFS